MTESDVRDRGEKFLEYEAAKRALGGLGATRGETRTEYGHNWTTLHDPDGNELCVAQQHDWAHG